MEQVAPQQAQLVSLTAHVATLEARLRLAEQRIEGLERRDMQMIGHSSQLGSAASLQQAASAAPASTSHKPSAMLSPAIGMQPNPVVPNAPEATAAQPSFVPASGQPACDAAGLGLRTAQGTKVWADPSISASSTHAGSNDQHLPSFSLDGKGSLCRGGPADASNAPSGWVGNSARDAHSGQSCGDAAASSPGRPARTLDQASCQSTPGRVLPEGQQAAKTSWTPSHSGKGPGRSKSRRSNSSSSSLSSPDQSTGVVTYGPPTPNVVSPADSQGTGSSLSSPEEQYSAATGGRLGQARYGGFGVVSDAGHEEASDRLGLGGLYGSGFVVYRNAAVATPSKTPLGADPKPLGTAAELSSARAGAGEWAEGLPVRLNMEEVVGDARGMGIRRIAEYYEEEGKEAREEEHEDGCEQSGSETDGEWAGKDTVVQERRGSACQGSDASSSSLQQHVQGEAEQAVGDSVSQGVVQAGDAAQVQDAVAGDAADCVVLAAGEAAANVAPAAEDAAASMGPPTQEAAASVLPAAEEAAANLMPAAMEAAANLMSATAGTVANVMAATEDAADSMVLAEDQVSPLCTQPEASPATSRLTTLSQVRRIARAPRTAAVRGARQGCLPCGTTKVGHKSRHIDMMSTLRLLSH